jgi:hypothetical protein
MYLYDSTNLLSYNCISIVKDVQLITFKIKFKAVDCFIKTNICGGSIRLLKHKMDINPNNLKLLIV